MTSSFVPPDWMGYLFLAFVALMYFTLGTGIAPSLTSRRWPQLETADRVGLVVFWLPILFGHVLVGGLAGAVRLTRYVLTGEWR